MHFFAIGTQVNPIDLNRGGKVVGAYYIEAAHRSDLLIQSDIPIKVYMPGCITVDQLITAGEAATLKSLKSMALNPGRDNASDCCYFSISQHKIILDLAGLNSG